MAHPQTRERRRADRGSAEGLIAIVREKGRLSQCRGEALDFNRYGLALKVEKPLPKEKTVFVSLCHGNTRLDTIVGVIHNCRPLADGGYRCGIQFRLNSSMQFDRGLIIAELLKLEKQMGQESAAG